MQLNLLSVILRLHTCKGEALSFLSNAILSLVGNNYEPIEALVVTQNLAPSDLQKVQETLDHFVMGERFSARIVNYASKATGDHRSALLNLGFESARGQYLAILDYDDYVYEHAYTVLIEQIKRSSASVVFGGCVYAHASSSVHGYKITEKNNPWREKTERDFLEDNIFPIHTFVIDRFRLAGKLPRFNEGLTRVEDYEFLMRLRMVTEFDVTCRNQVLFEYHLRTDGSNTSSNTDDWQDSRRRLEETRAQLFHHLEKKRAEPTEFAEFVASAYRSVLDRLPTAHESDAYVNLLRSGQWTKESVLFDLLGCDEYLQRTRNKVREFVPAGHFYSAVPNEQDRQKAIKSNRTGQIFDIDLRHDDQKQLVEKLLSYRTEWPFTSEPQEGLRYHYNNPAFTLADGYFLYAMLRHANPKKVIEIGSGYSSSLMLDVRERFFANELDLVFIEPYARLLKSLLKEGDSDRVRIHEQSVQEVTVEVFRELRRDDILFIDSTHVAKLGSDVCHLFFEVLPLLAEGVIIHVHDIFYPFEYPKSWIQEGRAWNELYLLRSFLMNNKDYEVMLFNSYACLQFGALIRDSLPISEDGGGSIWLRKKCPAASSSLS